MIHSTAYCKTTNNNIVAERMPSRTPLPTEWIVVTAVFSAALNGSGGVVVGPFSCV